MYRNTEQSPFINLKRGTYKHQRAQLILISEILWTDCCDVEALSLFKNYLVVFYGKTMAFKCYHHHVYNFTYVGCIIRCFDHDITQLLIFKLGNKSLLITFSCLGSIFCIHYVNESLFEVAFLSLVHCSLQSSFQWSYYQSFP